MWTCARLSFFLLLLAVIVSDWDNSYFLLHQMQTMYEAIEENRKKNLINLLLWPFMGLLRHSNKIVILIESERASASHFFLSLSLETHLLNFNLQTRVASLKNIVHLDKANPSRKSLICPIECIFAARQILVSLKWNEYGFGMNQWRKSSDDLSKWRSKHA